MLYEMQNIGYFYPGQIEALKNVSLKIEKGELLAILGANGCGKSTLLKLMAGLIFPNTGQIKFDDRPLSDKLLNSATDLSFVRKFRSQVGIVFQNSDTQLFCPTVFDEIAFGPLQLGLSKDEVVNRVNDVLHMLEISSLAHRAPHALSGGEKKRVAIASVLSLNPDVLLLDEPTAALDPRTQSWFEEFLHNLSDIKKTIIIATHDIDIVDSISERVVIFGENHQIAADGKTQSILANREMLLGVNLIHEHFHHHDELWHKHKELGEKNIHHH